MDENKQIQRLEIRNFKSLRHVVMDCGRVNVLIGRPNTGKSNFLEVIGLLSSGYHGFVKEFVRAEAPFDLLFGRNLAGAAEIHVVSVTGIAGKVEIRSDAEGVEGIYEWQRMPGAKESGQLFKYSFSGGGHGANDIFEIFKLYRFGAETGNRSNMKHLSPPGGGNLPLLVSSNSDLRHFLQEMLSDFDLRLAVERAAGGSYELKVIYDTGDLLVTFPWVMVSETMRRMAFFLSAMLTNKDSVLAIEEPEAHAFPPYAKFLAERIALDESNQYFVTTHNPYFLLSMLQKTPQSQIGCFATNMRDRQTSVRRLSPEDMRRVLDKASDVFFSMDEFFEEAR